MNVLQLLQLAAQRSGSTPPASTAGGTFLEGLLSGSLSGAPAGFDRLFPNVMGMEGSEYYPEFRFGYSGTPALERLGVTQPNGMPPGMAMQVAQSQYFAPGTGQGVNMAGQRQAAPAPAPAPGLPDVLKPVGPRWRGSPDNYASYDDYVNAGYYMPNR